MALVLIGVFLAGTLSVASVIVLINNAERLGLIQYANKRSSHERPTPSGGGLGIVLGSVLGGSLIWLGDTDLTVILGLSLVIAIMGFIDDFHPLPAKLRLAVQLALLSSLVITTDISVLISGNIAGIWLIFVTAGVVLAGVWWVNLFNFMDGIDGLAAAEALCMLAGALFLIVTTGSASVSHPLFGLMLSTAAALLGFFAFNWAPAKIFMGDIGSLFLGFLLFAFAILSAQYGWLSIWQWLILGTLFVTDATVTLVHRFAHGQPIMQAHKTHLYQRLARRWGAHHTVTIVLIIVDLAVLVPLAWAAQQWPNLAAVITTGTYTVSGLGALLFLKKI